MSCGCSKKGVKKLLLLSSATVEGYEFLEYASVDIKLFFRKNCVTCVLFVPYAMPDYDEYYKKVKDVFNKWGFEVDSIHKNCKPTLAVEKAQAICVGGGNTFRLLNILYEKNLLEPIRKAVLENGIPYMGFSAGSNIATPTIHTSNNMPIVCPPSFDALNFVPFNINPHYSDCEPTKGETREEKILQYIEIGSMGRSVLAMREGAHMLVEGDKATLMGITNSRLYQKGKPPKEFTPGTDVSFLLKPNSEEKIEECCKKPACCS